MAENFGRWRRRMKIDLGQGARLYDAWIVPDAK
jgi:hypothetical protein